MKKLKFAVPLQPKAKEGSFTVRVSAEAYNAIEAISAKTGLSNAYIASQMIMYAEQNTELVEEQEA